MAQRTLNLYEIAMSKSWDEQRVVFWIVAQDEVEAISTAKSIRNAERCSFVYCKFTNIVEVAG